MRKFLFLMLILLLNGPLYAQYTEIINTNRPGHSQGAFSVGNGVLQFEGGVHYGQDDHDLTDVKTKRTGLGYEVRYGLIWEELEINLRGDFLNAERNYTRGGSDESDTYTNFETNVFGAKYLLYDPYRKRDIEGPNLYSWKANHGLKWHHFIPAVAVYAGANLTFGDRPSVYPYFGEERGNISPKISLLTQHNWGHFVFVMNFTADRLTDESQRYSGIFTLTHAFSPRLSMFGEFQTINDDFYSDDLFRMGGAYLFNSNFQVDVSGLLNLKDTPKRWEVGVGVSYRLDFHSEDEPLDPLEKEESYQDRYQW